MILQLVFINEISNERRLVDQEQDSEDFPPIRQNSLRCLVEMVFLNSCGYQDFTDVLVCDRMIKRTQRDVVSSISILSTKVFDQSFQANIVVLLYN